MLQIAHAENRGMQLGSHTFEVLYFLAMELTVSVFFYGALT